MSTIAIQVEVNLGEATLNILQKFLQAAPAATEHPAKNETTKSEAKPEPAKTEPAPAAPADDFPFTEDLPGPITDEELRAAVKSAKDATSAADVKAVFAKFGIKTSIECPDDRRYDLLKELINLKTAK